ncbi:hypothetical protein SYNTR_1680 [Candidatus Syntrophocurvum alkaliphilum]|uniref:DUF1294 domain-containing protein n=1 Tax=Candidatus Syntrophocurvum alkaliphilum TaxID=2293317 RepID=A0A6I6DMJ8_9FIRM|nr:DUF1294 domain-containing protein [Candidatus Syntrophocurvum alkaliphilum]QGU00274.1 hypothetical protein SYNTR_1680 [Candidatus Syntrophocurvum alkaliphilum]
MLNELAGKALFFYLAFLNIITFVIFAWDKNQAIVGGWRISEAQLLFCSIIGGALGGLVSMRIFRHKTRHIKFSLYMVSIFFFQLVLLAFTIG